VAPPRAARPPARAAPTRLCVTGGVAKGVGADELLAGTFDVDVVVRRPRSRLQLAPSVGLVDMPKRNAGTLDEVSFWALILRLLGGASFGPVDVLAGPFVSPSRIGGATPHAGWLF